MSVPTEVIFGCDGVVTERAVATVPTRLLAFKFEIAEPFEATRRPCTLSPVSIPIDVMFDWAGFVTDWAVPTVPTRLLAFKFAIPEPFPK